MAIEGGPAVSELRRSRLTIRRAMLVIALVAIFLTPVVMLYRQSQVARMQMLRAMMAERDARAKAEQALYAATVQQARALRVLPKAEADPVLDEKKAIEIARGAVREKDTWADRATYKARQTEEGWTVSVWRIEGYNEEGEPLFTPGGFRTVVIDEQGKVTEYRRGL